MEKDDAPLTALRSCATEVLPPALHAAVIARGAAATAPLVAILEDADLAREDGPAEGWPPIHAVDLLAELRASDAVEPMLRMLAASPPDTVLHERLLSALARIGAKDERVYARLCEAFDADRAHGASRLADYGDARALAVIEAAIAGFEPDASRRFAIAPLLELVKAHERLGGRLPGKLRTRVDEQSQAWNVQQVDRAALAGGVSAPKLGRNDPCACGSGKKYKKCCLGRAPA